MPRQPRFFFPGAVLHIVQRGTDRRTIFQDAGDRTFFLGALGEAAGAHHVDIHAYALMSNHVHLLVSPHNENSAPRMMQSLGRRYVGRFNFVHERTGTLWEGRYRAALVDSDGYLLTCMRYIELNAVRAGMVRHPAEFRWSSFWANTGEGIDPVVTPHPVFLMLGASAGARHETYLRLFDDVLDRDAIATIRDATQHEWALGSPAFRESVEARIGRRTGRMPRGRPFTSAGRRAPSPTAE
ncbi:MAG: transposase [Casimicrobiaceae bacterium]